MLVCPWQSERAFIRVSGLSVQFVDVIGGNFDALAGRQFNHLQVTPAGKIALPKKARPMRKRW